MGDILSAADDATDAIVSLTAANAANAANAALGGPVLFLSGMEANSAIILTAVTDLAAVVTDLEGDTGGDSVAGAITDIGAVITDLEG